MTCKRAVWRITQAAGAIPTGEIDSYMAQAAFQSSGAEVETPRIAR
jgi:hypothetical protein